MAHLLFAAEMFGKSSQAEVPPDLKDQSGCG